MSEQISAAFGVQIYFSNPLNYSFNELHYFFMFVYLLLTVAITDLCLSGKYYRSLHVLYALK